MGGIFNFDKINQTVESADYKLVEVIFGDKARNTRIIVTCSDNHTYETSWSSFQNGNRCSICSNINNGIKLRKSTDEVYKIFESYGYRLLTPKSEYKNTHSKIKIECINGHIRNVSLNHFMKSIDCPDCSSFRYKYTHTEVKEYFNSHGYSVISNSYTDNKTKLKTICPEGHEYNVTFDDFKNGNVRCVTCAGLSRYEYDDVKKIFEENGCILTSAVYINSKTKLEYVCSCGNRSSISLSNFLRGVRCKKCYLKSNSGSNSRFWNPEKTDKKRLEDRKFIEYKDWRTSVFKRDSYTCQCCGDNKGGNLNAHHLDGWNWCIERRLDMSNGITLCDTCHKNFHMKYGYGDNTEYQFNEWVQKQIKIHAS